VHYKYGWRLRLVDTSGRRSITFATVEARKAPPSPGRVGVAKLETGSAVLT
jgi:hypothetical protein